MKRPVSLFLALCLLAGCGQRTLVPDTSGEDVSQSVSAGVSAVSEEPSSQPEESEEPQALPPLSLEADLDALSALSAESVTWGPGTFQDELGRSTACEGLQEQYGAYNAYFIGDESSNTVMLTFDEGYENGYTASILDTLREKGVQAVFFLTGHYARTQPELVKRMIEEGHVLGSHSDAHKVYCSELTPEESRDDAAGLQQLVREQYGYEMRLFRFPEGAFSEQSLSLIQQLGYRSVFWSFAYADWDVNNQPEPSAALEKIKKYIHPGEIMLLHPVSSTNAAILGDVIDAVRERGLEVGLLEGLGYDLKEK